jgi:thiol-disulfide isomerase/thioredoxin
LLPWEFTLHTIVAGRDRRYALHNYIFIFIAQRRTMKWISTVLVSIISVIACSDTTHNQKDSAVQAPKEAAATAANLPAFQMLDANDKIVDLQSFKGKKVFVNIWATWCPPCRAELPSIQKLMASIDTSKTAFVFLSLDDDFAKAKDFVKKKKMPLPVFYPAQALPSLFNVQSIPTTFIFDEKGKLIHDVMGAENYDTDGYRKLLN